MRRLGIMATGVLAFAAAMSAQVVWLEGSYDFGLMKELAGPKQGFARFVNRGSEPVTVIEARPTCGCTEATFPQDPVEPGDTAVIRFTYDPTGRPGRFDKSIRVRFGDGQRAAVKISGNVLGTPESLQLFYPVDAGALRLSDGRIIAGNVSLGRTPSLFVNAYNTLGDSVPVAVRCDEKALKLKLSETKAGPGDIVTLAMYLDTKAYGKVGPFSIPVTVVSNPGTPDEQSCRIDVVGQVVPVRVAVPAEVLKNAPVCSAMPPVVDMGIVNKEKRQMEFAVLNEGKSVLEIQNVWCDMPAVRILSFPDKIKRNKGGKVIMEFNPEEVTRTPFRIAVKVASNDPVNPLKEVFLTGSVEENF